MTRRSYTETVAWIAAIVFLALAVFKLLYGIGKLAWGGDAENSCYKKRADLVLPTPPRP